MFNTHTQNLSVSNHVNAVTGNIVKTYRDSYFKRFHLKSQISDILFSPNADTIVIQMTLCGDMDVIAELISKKKYDEMFKEDVK